MFKTVIDNSPLVTVNSGKFVSTYALDGSLMNPLEAFYACLAACAGVFAKKACKELGLSPEGISIDCKPFAGAGGPLTLSRYRTEVHFPAHFTAEQKRVIIDSINACAVKEIVKDGPNVEFIVSEV